MDYYLANMLKDESFVARFEPKELYQYRHEFTLINDGTLHPDVWFNKLKRIHDDQTVFNDTTKRYFEPIGVGISGNKLVTEGLTGIAQAMVGGKTRIYDVYGIGEGTVTVDIRDTGLSDQVLRLEIKENGGFIINRGTTCFWSLFFPKTVKSTTITETALFDNLTAPDTMLLRTLFPIAERQVHAKDFDIIYCGHIVYTGSV